MISNKNRSELFQGALQTSGRQTQGSTISNQSQANANGKGQASPRKAEQRKPHPPGHVQQPHPTSIYTQMLLKQTKSKGKVLQKKNSVNAMPVLMGCQNSHMKYTSKLHEKRTDSCSNDRNRRLARKFNSISPKM